MAKKTGKELADVAKNMVLGSLAGKKKVVKTVDATPDWVGLVPLFMDWIQNGNPQQYEEAQRNLMQMARISDSYRKNQSLIMASPDMYEALKTSLKIFGRGYKSNGSRVYLQMKEALDKADGK
jgi:hypothetical protein